MDENKKEEENKVSSLGFNGLYFGTLWSTTFTLEKHRRDWLFDKEKLKEEIKQELYEKISQELYEKISHDLLQKRHIEYEWENLEHPKENI